MIPYLDKYFLHFILSSMPHDHNIVATFVWSWLDNGTIMGFSATKHGHATSFLSKLSHRYNQSLNKSVLKNLNFTFWKAFVDLNQFWSMITLSRNNHQGHRFTYLQWPQLDSQYTSRTRDLSKDFLLQQPPHPHHIHTSKSLNIFSKSYHNCVYILYL